MRAARRARAAARLARAARLLPTLTARPPSHPAGDIFAYCKFCAPNDICVELIKDGHAGNITGVTAEAYRDHGWHAGQAFNILANVSAVCPIYT